MKSFVFFLLFFYTQSVLAQQKYNVAIKLSGGDKSILNKINYDKAAADSVAVYKVAEKILSQLQFKGFSLAEIVAVDYAGFNAEVTIKPQQQYRYVTLGAGNLSNDAQQAVGFKAKFYNQAVFDLRKLEQLFQNLLNYYDVNGYPFASISLDSIGIGKNEIIAKINTKLNEKFVYDSLHAVGTAKVNQQYLQTYLNVKAKSLYNENTINNINNRLRELPFVDALKNPSITFNNGKADITVYINKRNANQFDGILGLQQSPIDNKIQLVGNLKLRLQNAFKRGELIDLNYQGLQGKSQLLELKTEVPNILSTDFGINPGLKIYKQDTSFLNVDTKLGFSYLFKGYNAMQVYVENQSTSLIAVDAYKNATELPGVLDANTTFYGFGFNFETLDYRFNPRKGYLINFNASVGSKKIRKNSAIADVLYQDISLSSTSYKLLSEINYFIPLGKQVVLALSNETGILSGKYLVDNELFRLGGQRSLRGFNELSILANAYTYANAEIRYLLAQNSFLFAFYNQAYVKQKTNRVNIDDFPIGFGTGVNFETGIGIISISYALGKQQNNPLNLRQGKIHFGIIALF
jgi:outer membrane protein assembly factor BamA